MDKLEQMIRLGLTYGEMADELGIGETTVIRRVQDHNLSDLYREMKKEALKRVEEAVRRLQYGKVIVTIQGGKPIMVETQQQERIG